MRKSVKAGIVIAVLVALITCISVGVKSYVHSLSPRKEYTRNGNTIYVESLNYYVNNEQICGTVYKPQDSLGKKPLVIYCHGLGSTMKGSEKLCRMIAGKGYVAYAFDFRGGSPNSKSSGEPLDMTVQSEVEDLEAIISRIRKENFVNNKQIYLMGHSQGALVAALAAHKEKGIKGLILLAPAFNLPDLAEEYYPKNRQIPDSTDFLNVMTVGKKYFTEAKGLKPYKNLSKFKGDVLIIHGSSDNLVPVKYATDAALEYKSVDMQVLDGIGHSFNGNDGDKMMAIVGEYLDEHKKK